MLSIYKNINRKLSSFSIVIFGFLFVFSGSSFAAEMDHSQHGSGHDMSKHSGHIVKPGTHVHHNHGVGSFMFEYRFMRMDMKGLLDGKNSVGTRDISGATMGMPPTNNMNTAYMMSPTKMDMDMQMLMVMYGVTDKLSIMGMLNYFSNEMDMVMHMYTPANVFAGDMTGTMETSGFGDTRVTAMFTLNNVIASIGLNIPTGSIDEKVTMKMAGTNILNSMPMTNTNANIQAPYAMQLGSGTIDLIPSVTYQENIGNWHVGAQASYTFHSGENDNNYTLGDIADITAWSNYSITPTFTVSGRLAILDWDKIDGQDPLINPMMAPTSDPNATGGTRADLFFGLSKKLSNHIVSLEIGAPIYQDLNGPQLETDFIYSFGYQYLML